MAARPLLFFLIALLLATGCAERSASSVGLSPVPKFPPPKDLSGSTEIVFLVMGDTGRGNAIQGRVAKLMAGVCQQRRPGTGCDFALVAGDLIYDSGVSGVNDPKFRTHFEQPFSPLGSLPMWSVPGNHDWVRAGSVQAEINYTAVSPSKRWLMPSFNFDVPGLPSWLHIFGIDTSTMDDTRRARGGALKIVQDVNKQQVETAKAALCGKEGWRFLFGHHPVYSSGQHGRDEGAGGKLTSIHTALVDPLIKACKLQIYFAGHDHMQEHLSAESDKFEQVIQGAVAEARVNDRDIRLSGVKSKFRSRDYGFALVTVNAKSVLVEFFGFKAAQNPGPNLPPAYQFELTH
jgi:acid phosphatase